MEAGRLPARFFFSVPRQPVGRGAVCKQREDRWNKNNKNNRRRANKPDGAKSTASRVAISRTDRRLSRASWVRSGSDKIARAASRGSSRTARSKKVATRAATRSSGTDAAHDEAR
jgi:hypothetical protein